MNNSWMPKTAGILDIVAGLLSLLAMFILGLGVLFYSFTGPSSPNIGITEITIIFWFIAIPKILLSILAIIGGIYTLRKKKWGMALTGSIAAIFSSFFLGIASIIFTIVAKEEFK